LVYTVGMEKKLLTLQLPEKTRVALKVIAAQRGISLRQLLEPAINEVILNSVATPSLSPGRNVEKP